MTTSAGVSVTVDVLANDTDPDGDDLDVFVLSGTGHGALDTSGGPGLTYTPDPGFSGTDSFAYILRDGNGGFDVAKAEITVAEEPNRPPSAHADSVALAPGSSARVDVLGNDRDPDGDSLTVSIAAQPDDIAAAVGPDGSIRIDADDAFDGVDSVTYAVSDGNGGVDRTVLEVRPPAADASPAEAARNVSVTLNGAEADVGDRRDAVVDTVEAAWSLWSRAFTDQTEIELEVRMGDGDSLASARPGTLDTTSDPNGIGQVVESGVIDELTSGIDPNGNDPDGIININSDPDSFTWRTDRDTPVAEGTYDGLTVMAHEIGHILGFTGFHESSDENHYAATGRETTYDAFVEETDDGAFVFDGPATRAVNDGPVALGRVDPFHLADPNLLMASAIGQGETREVSDTELAMLQDMGAPVTLETGTVDPVA